ncbi:MAG: methyltransferase domain-containing protein [Bacteroidota bacterium]
MRFKCPNCQEIREANTFPCANCIEQDGSVIRLMRKKFWTDWKGYLQDFKAFREQIGARVTDPNAYENMPFGEGENDLLSTSWKERRMDLQFILNHLSEWSAAQERTEKLQILNYGAWNGWLSHQLALNGHELVTVSPYDDPYDGIGAVKHFSTDWVAIQMELTDVDLFVDPFDVIIFNRNLAFFEDPMQALQNILPKVKPGGLVLLSGLTFFRKEKKATENFQRKLKAATEKFKIKLDYQPMKGILDTQDKHTFEALGGRFTPYPPVWKNQWLPLLLPNRATYGFGVIKRD